jgi:hypothetical protein
MTVRQAFYQAAVRGIVEKRNRPLVAVDAFDG